jgi:SAM-dependent methyltransferase
MKENNLEEKRFFWRTNNPHVKLIENQLLKNAFKNIKGRNILEAGCGTGANFVFLKDYFSDLTGVDINEEALSVGRRYVPAAKFLPGTVQEMPFSDGAFDAVFMRDVLHHIYEESGKKLVLKEIKRVCRDNGHLVIIEPNYNNIVIWLQSKIRPEEKGLKNSKAEDIKKWLADTGFRQIKISEAEPLPLDRFILHYRSGWPWLSNFSPVRFLFNFFNSIYKILIPKRFWAYLVIRAEK